MIVNRLIVFEGVDKSGKSTQARMLYHYLKDNGHKCVLVNFPNRETPIGSILNNYLKGDVKLDPHVQHLLFSANRWESLPQILSYLNNGYFVIFDRYIHSGIVYSLMNGLSLEFAGSTEVGLPKEEICFLMNIDVKQRYNKVIRPRSDDYNQGHNKKYEKYENIAFAMRAQKKFRDVVRSKDSNRIVIDGDRYKKVIHKEIVELVKEKYTL